MREKKRVCKIKKRFIRFCLAFIFSISLLISFSFAVSAASCADYGGWCTGSSTGLVPPYMDRARNQCAYSIREAGGDSSCMNIAPNQRCWKENRVSCNPSTSSCTANGCVAGVVSSPSPTPPPSSTPAPSPAPSQPQGGDGTCYNRGIGETCISLCNSRGQNCVYNNKWSDQPCSVGRGAGSLGAPGGSEFNVPCSRAPAGDVGQCAYWCAGTVSPPERVVSAPTSGTCATAAALSGAGRISLNCPSGSFISSIERADYVNADSQYSCTQSGRVSCIGRCSAPNIEGSPERSCMGQPGCSFAVGNAVCGGDPCPGRQKKLIFNVNCQYPAPVFSSFLANPSTITAGQSFTLSWSAQNANSCLFITPSNPSGATMPTANSFPLSPTQQGVYTYTIRCAGNGGSVERSATVTVLRNPCEGVVCNNPAASCDGNVRVRYTTTATCSNGACVNGQQERVDCAALGQACRSGDCITLPSFSSFSAAPLNPMARNEKVKISWRSNAESCKLIFPGGSEFPQSPNVDNIEIGPFSSAGSHIFTARCYKNGNSVDRDFTLTVSNNACDGVVCNTPVATRCINSMRFWYQTPGTCFINSNRQAQCSYVLSSEDCANSGKICSDNACVLPAVNGLCGSANLAKVAAKPSSALCASGSPTEVSGNGPWAWTCSGANGGKSASCLANTFSAPVMRKPSYTGECKQGSRITVTCAADDADGDLKELKIWAGDCIASDCSNTRSWSGNRKSFITYAEGKSFTPSSIGSGTASYDLTISQDAGTGVAVVCQAIDGRGLASSFADAYPICTVGACSSPPTFGSIQISAPQGGNGRLQIRFTSSKSDVSPVVGVKPSSSPDTSYYPAARISQSGSDFVYAIDRFNMISIFQQGGSMTVRITGTDSAQCLGQALHSFEIRQPSVSFSISPSKVIQGSSTTYSYSSADANECTFDVGQNGRAVSATTLSSLSGSNIPISTQNTGIFDYMIACYGPGGARTASQRLEIVLPPVNGQCGPASGQTRDSQPQASELCSKGTASVVESKNEGWAWNCNGLNEGTTANCMSYKRIAASLTISPESVLLRASAAYSFTSAGATSCALNKGTAQTPLQPPSGSGQLDTSSAGTFAYSLSCTGPSGTIGDTKSLQVCSGTFYRDIDRDGYGDPAASAQACSAPPGFVENNNDCYDRNANIKPGANELCNNVDDNCNGRIDENLTSSEGCSQLGSCAGSIKTCNAGAWSGCSKLPIEEICNGADDNCNGQADEGVNTWYADSDRDGYGRLSITATTCTRPSDQWTKNVNPQDCNDNNISINPAAPEICSDSADNNCNGQIDCDDASCDGSTVRVNNRGYKCVLGQNCRDGARGTYESDIDCGGICGSSCRNGAQCIFSSDCSGNYCNPNRICSAPSCNDGFQNQGENGIDCGGPCEKACRLGKITKGDTSAKLYTIEDNPIVCKNLGYKQACNAKWNVVTNDVEGARYDLNMEFKTAKGETKTLPTFEAVLKENNPPAAPVSGTGSVIGITGYQAAGAAQNNADKNSRCRLVSMPKVCGCPEGLVVDEETGLCTAETCDTIKLLNDYQQLVDWDKKETNQEIKDDIISKKLRLNDRIDKCCEVPGRLGCKSKDNDVLSLLGLRKFDMPSQPSLSGTASGITGSSILGITGSAVAEYDADEYYLMPLYGIKPLEIEGAGDNVKFNFLYNGYSDIYHSPELNDNPIILTYNEYRDIRLLPITIYTSEEFGYTIFQLIGVQKVGGTSVPEMKGSAHSDIVKGHETANLKCEKGNIKKLQPYYFCPEDGSGPRSVECPLGLVGDSSGLISGGIGQPSASYVFDNAACSDPCPGKPKSGRLIAKCEWGTVGYNPPKTVTSPQSPENIDNLFYVNVYINEKDTSKSYIWFYDYNRDSLTYKPISITKWAKENAFGWSYILLRRDNSFFDFNINLKPRQTEQNANFKGSHLQLSNGKGTIGSKYNINVIHTVDLLKGYGWIEWWSIVEDREKNALYFGPMYYFPDANDPNKNVVSFWSMYNLKASKTSDNLLIHDWFYFDNNAVDSASGGSRTSQSGLSVSCNPTELLRQLGETLGGGSSGANEIKANIAACCKDNPWLEGCGGMA